MHIELIIEHMHIELIIEQGSFLGKPIGMKE